jgi:hypothetical protein
VVLENAIVAEADVDGVCVSTHIVCLEASQLLNLLSSVRTESILPVWLWHNLGEIEGALAKSTDKGILSRGRAYWNILIEPPRGLYKLYKVLFIVKDRHGRKHPKEGCDCSMRRLFTRRHVEHEGALPALRCSCGSGELKQTVPKTG